MKPHVQPERPSRVRVPVRRPTGRVRAWLAASALAACATVEPERHAEGDDVEQLAARLVLAAQERTDLRPVRVWVADVRPAESAQAPQPVRTAAHADPPDTPGPPDRIGERLGHELVLALATRLNVVETELAAADLAAQEGTTLQERAAARGATHLVLSDYLRRRDVLLTTVRLVDAESRLIVAAVRGEVRLGPGGLEGVDATAPKPGTRERVAVPVVAASAPASAPSTAEDAATLARRASVPATAAPAPARAAPAASPAPLAPPRAESDVRRWPMEDFETWYQRRIAEREASPAVPTPSTPPPVDDGADAQFPWRRHTWLARLLGVPETSPKPR
jgi:hypothetical protein